MSDECSGTYTKRIDSYGAYLCFLAVLRRAVDDLKPHNPPDIQAEAAVWLRTEGRRWITRLRISRTCEDEHVQRLVYGGITNRQESLWEDRT